MPKLLVVPQGSNAIEAAIPILGRQSGLDVFVSPDFDTALGSILPAEYHGVLTAATPDAPGLLELMVRCDTETSALPFFAQLERPADIDPATHSSPTLHWQEDQAPAEPWAQTILAAMTDDQLPSRRRGRDYLHTAILCQRSVNLDLDLADGEQITVDIVGGDVWNAYASSTEAAEALTLAFHGTIVEAVHRSLHTIPGERQLHRRGTEVLRPARRQQPASAPARSQPDLVTQEITLDQVAADFRQNASSEDNTPAEDPFENLLTEGIEASLSRDYQRAARCFEAALELRPDDAGVRFNLERVQQHLTP